MSCQTLFDLEEMMRFYSKTGFSSKQLRFSQRGTGKTECLTADQWLDRYAGWCEPFKARISAEACKSRQGSGLSEFCMGCKGILKRSAKPVECTCLPKSILA